MDVNAWLAAAKEDARQRQVPELLPLLDGLAVSTAALRRADAEASADPPADRPEDPPQ